jgi:putative ABC transport system permease protein
MQSVQSEVAKAHNRLTSMSTQGFAGPVPIACVDKVRQFEGIKAATPYRWYGGNYKDERAQFAQFGVDGDEVFKVWDEFEIDPEQLKDWQNDKEGCVVDRRLAERFDWKIGDRIPLKGTFFQFDLDLRLCGLFDAPQDTGTLWYHWKYLDEGLRNRKARGDGNCGMIFAKATSAEVMPALIEKIDAEYASSDTPLRTQTESAFAQMFSTMIGNVQALIQSIGLAVVFSLSLVAANAMAMSMRERTTEIAVLKAIGFPRGRVLKMILGEACLIAFLGGVLGIGAGLVFIETLHHMVPQAFRFGVSDLLGPWIGALLLASGGIGLISGIVPAIRAAQLPVIDGLRRVV